MRALRHSPILRSSKALEIIIAINSRILFQGPVSRLPRCHAHEEADHRSDDEKKNGCHSVVGDLHQGDAKHKGHHGGEGGGVVALVHDMEERIGTEEDPDQ